MRRTREGVLIRRVRGEVGSVVSLARSGMIDWSWESLPPWRIYLTSSPPCQHICSCLACSLEPHFSVDKGMREGLTFAGFFGLPVSALSIIHSSDKGSTFQDYPKGLIEPLILIMIGASMAPFIFAFTGLRVIVTDPKLLPAGVRAAV